MGAIQIDLTKLINDRHKNGPMNLTRKNVNNFCLKGYRKLYFTRRLRYGLHIYNRSYGFLHLIFYFHFTTHNDHANENFHNITYNNDIYNIEKNINLNNLLTKYILNTTFIKAHEKRKNDIRKGYYNQEDIPISYEYDQETDSYYQYEDYTYYYYNHDYIYAGFC